MCLFSLNFDLEKFSWVCVLRAVAWHATENTWFPSSSQVRHTAAFQPSTLWAPARLSPGWAARIERVWKKDSSHRTAAPGPSHHHCLAQTLHHQSKKVISKRLFLVKHCKWVHCPCRRGVKNRRNWETNSLVVMKLNCHLCMNRWQYISQSHAQAECLSYSTLHLLGSKIRAPQACSLFLSLST